MTGASVRSPSQSRIVSERNLSLLVNGEQRSWRSKISASAAKSQCRITLRGSRSGSETSNPYSRQLTRYVLLRYKQHQTTLRRSRIPLRPRGSRSRPSQPQHKDIPSIGSQPIEGRITPSSCSYSCRASRCLRPRCRRNLQRRFLARRRRPGSRGTPHPRTPTGHRRWRSLA